MEAYQISQSNLLEIFAIKNKAYDELQKSYNRRITTAVIVTMQLILLFIICSFLRDKMEKVETVSAVVPAERTLMQISTIPPNLPHPVRQPLRVPVSAIKFPPPRVVKDELVKILPPEVKELEVSRIDLKTLEGAANTVVVASPAAIAGSSLTLQKRSSTGDTVFKTAEIEAVFPGGPEAWQQYIKRAILEHLDEFADADYGTCIVRFIVDKNGKVSNVEATTMRGSRLAEIAVKTIQNGPEWIPGMQNGHYVNAYRFQPVTLKNPRD